MEKIAFTIFIIFFLSVEEIVRYLGDRVKWMTDSRV